MALPCPLLQIQDVSHRRPFQTPFPASFLREGNSPSTWLLPRVPSLTTRRVGDGEVLRQNGALGFWSCCWSWCPWPTGCPVPARAARLWLPITLLSGSAFGALVTHCPSWGVGSALTQLLSHCLSWRPWLSAPSPGRALPRRALVSSCPQQVPVLQEPVLRGSVLPATLPAALAPSGSQPKSLVQLICIECASCGPP